MPSQQQIERFTLAFHRRALERLHADPVLICKALDILNRWEAQGASSEGQRYRDDWRRLLQDGTEAIERAVFEQTDIAATLRSMSPLGFVLEPDERLRIRREAMS